MAVRLPALPTGAKTLRISTTLEVYFDRVFVAHEQACPDAVITEHPLATAELTNEGFPRRITHAQHRPEYVDADRAPFWDTRHPAGFYTAFGRCDELVADEDGALVIIGPGEDVVLRYQYAKIPAKYDIWTRRYVINAVGWCKDMDLYTDTRDSIEPLPASPKTNRSAKDAHRFSTRWMSGK